jgi:hypothetical protein
MNEFSQEDLSHDARAQLRMAKLGLSPQAEDRTRVHAAVTAALAVSTAGAIGVAKASTGQNSSGLPDGGLLRSAPVMKGLLVIAVVGGLSGTVGYKLGYSKGLHTAAAPAPVALQPPLIETPHTAPRLVPTLPIAPPAVPPTPEEPAEDPEIRSVSKSSPRNVSPTVSALPAGTSPEAEEILQLERVQRALRDGYPALALAILGELDQKVPRGSLIEERTAAKIIARCSLGETSSARPTAFVEHYPNSMYLGRIARACSAMNSKSSEVGTETEPVGQE